MDKKALAFFVSLIVLFAASHMIEDESQHTLVESRSEAAFSKVGQINAYYFYGDGCPHCSKVKPFISDMERQFPITIDKYEIYNDRHNIELLNQFFDEHAVPTEQRGVPALFVLDSCLVGDEPILSKFEEIANEVLRTDAMANSASDLLTESPEEPIEESACTQPTAPSECLALATVTTAALVDSISPCSLAVLLFLIGVRPLVPDRKKRALKVGLAFVLSVFVTYTLFGLGLLSMIRVAGLSSMFSLIAGLIAIVAGALYVKDSLWRGAGGFVMEIPRSLRPLTGRMIKGVTSPMGAFFIGFAICCFELPCTGGPYLFILGQLANTATKLQAIPLLLYYNLLFVLPLLLATLLLYFGFFTIKKAREWNEGNKGLLRLGSGLTIIVLGFLVIPSSELVGLIHLVQAFCRTALPPVLLTLTLYLVFSYLQPHQTKAKPCAKAILLVILTILSILAYPQLSGDIEANVATNVGDTNVDSSLLGLQSGYGSQAPSTYVCAGSSCCSRGGTCGRLDALMDPWAYTGVGIRGTNGGVIYNSGSEIFVERSPDYKVLLKSRDFIPTTGVSRELGSVTDVVRVHVIIQFVDIPSADELLVLENRAIDLQDYLPNFAYFASVPVEEFDYLASQANVRSVIPIQVNDKISPYIRDYGIGSWTRNEDGTVNLTTIFFDDITKESAVNLVEAYGKVYDAPEKSNTLTISIPESSIYALAAEDAVQWIEPTPPPPTTNLDQARGTIGADIVQASPYNLDGTGVTVAMWDEGRVDPNHDDFAGRLIIGDAWPTTRNHSTHVCGIMAGDGTLSSGNMRGVAVNSDIRSYEWPNTISELDTETTNAIANNAILSQNSWGWTVDPPTYPCSLHGDYDSWTQRYDQVVNGVLGNEISLVGAAGNEENDGDCAPYPWNQTIGPICPAKNSICVGAIYSDSLDHTCFSSRGPTDDGRLKPELVAPGDEAFDNPISCLMNRMINSTFPSDTYGEMAGTSMAAPMVSGAIALLRQQYNKLGYGEIKPHTFKAILTQAANDLGNPGPDYTFGHGNLDIQEAVDLVINNYPNNELIRIGTVVDNEIDSYYMSVPSGLTRLRVTLAWDDVEGTVAAAKELVNDLDLYLRSPSGTYYYAYTLDPSNPGNNAGTGWNSRDNLEVVEVPNPEPGRWTVRAWGWVVTGTEEYTVVMPYEDINCGDYLYHNTQLGHDLTCPGNGLIIAANTVTLDCQGRTIQGSDVGVGVQSTYNYGTIQSCTIRDFDTGIELFSIADVNRLLNNRLISNDFDGIYLNDAWSNEIKGNYGYMNGISGGNGVFLYDSRYNDILNNDFESNYWHGIQLRGTSHYNDILSNFAGTNSLSGVEIETNYNLIRNNTVTANSYHGFELSSTLGNTLDYNWAETNGQKGIYVYNSSNTLAVYNRLYRNYEDGIYLFRSMDTTVRDSEFVENYADGILVLESNSSVIRTSLFVQNNLSAIELVGSHYNNVTLNNVTLSGINGIRMIGSSYSIIAQNTLEDIYAGSSEIVLWTSNDNYISDNVIDHGAGMGIRSLSSNNLQFYNNTVCGDSWDFYMDTTTYIANENYCDEAYQFIDSGQTTGCDFECSGCRKVEDNLVVSRSIQLCPYTYNIEDLGSLGVITIGANNVEIDCQGAEIVGVSTTGTGIMNSGYDYVTVRNCKIYNYWSGITFSSGSNYGYILNNNLSANGGGMRLSGSNYGTISGNTANFNTQRGLILSGNSDYNTLGNNVAKGNVLEGIQLYTGCDNNYVVFNTVTENNYGIYIYYSNNNYLHGNIVEDNINTGVVFTSSLTNNNELDHNRVCRNTLDISDPGANFGDNNFCTTTSNWDDTGTTGCTFSCLLGDINVDGIVNAVDMYLLSKAYITTAASPSYHPGADVDVDDDVDQDDLRIVSGNYGKTS